VRYGSCYEVAAELWFKYPNSVCVCGFHKYRHINKMILEEPTEEEIAEDANDSNSDI
jgi:hypothetical protein